MRLLRSPVEDLRDEFHKFLTNDWVHVEKKVAALDAKVQLLLGLTMGLIGLMVYSVVK
jgi:hypothetical protein